MKIEHFEDIENIQHEIDDFFTISPRSNFFQSTKAFLFFKRVKGFSPHYFISFEDGKILGILLAIFINDGGRIKQYFSARCIVYGGPLVLENDSAVAFALLRALSIFTKTKAIYTEIRNLYDASTYKKAFLNNGFTFVEHLNYIVPIKSVAENKKLLSSSRRRQIQKGEKQGAIIDEAHDDRDIYDFYKILNELYQRRIKKPLPDISFFLAFYQMRELGKVFIIRHSDQIIGGIICPVDSKTIYEWYVCGLDEQFKECYPSVLATWAPIEYAAKNGLQSFDFLGAGKPGDDYGVREFKSKFGGALVDYGRYIRINRPFLYRFGLAAMKIVGKFT